MGIWGILKGALLNKDPEGDANLPFIPYGPY